VDRPGVRPEKAKAVLQVPDPGAGEGVPFQCIRVQAETLGAGQEFAVDRATGKRLIQLFLENKYNNIPCSIGQDMVPEPAHEEQEELAAPGQSAEQ